VIKKKRRFIIYFAISILTEYVDLKIDIIHDMSSINTILSKNKNIYRDVKKNEVSSKQLEPHKPPIVDKIDHAFIMLNGFIPVIK